MSAQWRWCRQSWARVCGVGRSTCRVTAGGWSSTIAHGIRSGAGPQLATDRLGSTPSQLSKVSLTWTPPPLPSSHVSSAAPVGGGGAEHQTAPSHRGLEIRRARHPSVRLLQGHSALQRAASLSHADGTTRTGAAPLRRQRAVPITRRRLRYMCGKRLLGRASLTAARRRPTLQSDGAHAS